MKSLKEVNFIVETCSLCRDESSEQWMCQQCREIFCTDCTVAHLKSKTSKNHIIVSANPKLDYTICNIHPPKVLDRYCKTCERFLCPECITTAHKNHKFIKISDIVKQKRDSLVKTLNKLQEMKVPILAKAMQSLEQNQVSHKRQMMNLINDVNEQAVKLKAAVDRVRYRIATELQRKMDEEQNMLKGTEEQIEDELINLKQIMETCQENLDQMPNTEIIKYEREMSWRLNHYMELNPKLPVVNIPNFVPTELDPSLIDKIYGFLDEDREFYQTSAYNLDALNKTVPELSPENRILASFKHDKEITHVSTNHLAGHAWLAHYSGDFALVRYNALKLSEFKSDFKINDMVDTPSGDVIVVLSSSPIIKRLDKSGSHINILDMSPYQPGGIFVIDDDNYLVTLRMKDKHGKVVKISSAGITKDTLEYNEADWTPLFMLPYRLLQNTNDDLWVRDDSTKTLVVVDPIGRRRFTYAGPPWLRMEKPFSPGGLVHDKYGQIVVSDTENANVQLVSKDGRFLRYILTNEQLLADVPADISIDATGYIWVACYRGKVFVVKYLK